jgi:hypothetical protein
MLGWNRVYRRSGSLPARRTDAPAAAALRLAIGADEAHKARLHLRLDT